MQLVSSSKGNSPLTTIIRQTNREPSNWDRFGYLSIHYVVRLKEERAKLTEWQAFAPLRAEIQIRTVLQHAWAAIDHRFRYKTTTEIPTHLRRKLFRLSALLELADEEFLNLKRLKEQAARDYANQVEAGELDMELNLTSLAAYFSQTKEHEYWAKVSRAVGFKAYAPPSGLDEEVHDISTKTPSADPSGHGDYEPRGSRRCPRAHS